MGLGRSFNECNEITNCRSIEMLQRSERLHQLRQESFHVIHPLPTSIAVIRRYKFISAIKERREYNRNNIIVALQECWTWNGGVGDRDRELVIRNNEGYLTEQSENREEYTSQNPQRSLIKPKS